MRVCVCVCVCACVCVRVFNAVASCPCLLSPPLQVRHYRDNDKIRKKADEVYSALHVAFVQGGAGGSAKGRGHINAGTGNRGKATPKEEEPVLWNVIDTNDDVAVQSIKTEEGGGGGGGPPSPSPRRSQRSSVKNNRVNYSKLLEDGEEEEDDEGKDQQVPMS